MGVLYWAPMITRGVNFFNRRMVREATGIARGLEGLRRNGGHLPFQFLPIFRWMNFSFYNIKHNMTLIIYFFFQETQKLKIKTIN